MPKNAGGSQLGRTLRSLLFISGLGVVLAVWNSYSVRRDIALSTGPKSTAQEEFLVEAAERPDIATFFKNLTAAQRLSMARNIGRYQDAELAKLCGVLLIDFDAAARAELTRSLSKIAVSQPRAVAAELKEKGSFQVQGVSAALRAQGPSALSAVIPLLSVEEAKSNAAAFLVSSGPSAIGSVLPLLDSPIVALRRSAAEVLGKVRAKEAVPKLVELYKAATADEKTTYLSSLAGIGDPSTENIMKGVLDDPSLLPEVKVQAELGLGRIASDSAAKALWSHAQDDDETVKSGALSALELCPDVALKQPGVPMGLRLQVASTLIDPVTDGVILTALGDPVLKTAAAKACVGRVTLAKDLYSVLNRGRTAEDGEFANAAVEALASTAAGRRLLHGEASNPLLEGFISRQGLLGSP